MKSFTLDIDEYRFLVDVLDYVNVPPFDGPARLCDNDWDFHGYEHLDFEVVDVLSWSDEGEALPLLEEKDVQKIISVYIGIVEDKLLEMLLKLREYGHE